jgi:hypothetical protein
MVDFVAVRDRPAELFKTDAVRSLTSVSTVLSNIDAAVKHAATAPSSVPGPNPTSARPILDTIGNQTHLEISISSRRIHGEANQRITA